MQLPCQRTMVSETNKATISTRYILPLCIPCRIPTRFIEVLKTALDTWYRQTGN